MNTGWAGRARGRRPFDRPRTATTRRALRLAVARHRRLLAAGCAAAAVAGALQALSPSPPATQPVWVAAADLPAGHVLAAGDLRRADWPPGTRPAGSLTSTTGAGRRLAGPVRAGEPLTDARLVGTGLLRGQPPGTLAVALPVAQAAALRLVRAGDVVDVLAAQDASLDVLAASGTGTRRREAAPADVVARRVLVLAVLSGQDGSGGGLLGGGASMTGDQAGGAGIVVAVDATTAQALTGAAAAGQVTLALRAA